MSAPTRRGSRAGPEAGEAPPPLGRGAEINSLSFIVCVCVYVYDSVYLCVYDTECVYDSVWL